MREPQPAVAMGYALVDYKQRLAEEISFDDKAAAQFIKESAHLHACAGGSVANTLVAYQRYSQLPARLYYCVGDDKRGEFFYEQTGDQLGLPQIAGKDETGCCLLNLDDGGGIFDEITLDGAAASVTVPLEDLHHRDNTLVISNVNTLRNPSILDKTPALLQTLNRRRSVFALRLSGAHSLLATGREAKTTIEDLPAVPDVVFGNTAEIENIFDGIGTPIDLDHLLPKTRIIFVTDGGNKVLMRYEADTFSLQPETIDKVVDVSGAGDHFMGVTLAEMMRRPPAEWSSDFVLRAAGIGIKAAGLALSTMDSRLSREQLIQVGDRRP